MASEGPPLESLTRRLAECPAEFLAEPRVSEAGKVHVAAVVADVLYALGGPRLTPAQLAAFQPADAARFRNWLSLVLVACWLLDDPYFRGTGQHGRAAIDFLTGDLAQVAALSRAPGFVTDADRREELARLCLKALGLRPAGESDAQAQDRLNTLSTVERDRLVKATRRAEERAREVREAMATKAAEEAAAQYSRE